MSSRSTEVITACFIPIFLMDCATFSGSAQSRDSGRPVRTPQNPHERVQMFPKIIKVAVPSVQHSPMFGHEPEVQIVCKSYLSTKPRNSVYFLPTGSLTRNHFGFGWVFLLVLVASTVVSIDLRSEEHTSELQSRGHLV